MATHSSIPAWEIPQTDIGRTDAEAPIPWPPDVKSLLTGKDPDAGNDWRQEEKGMTEDKTLQEMVKDREAWSAAVQHHQIRNSYQSLFTVILSSCIKYKFPCQLFSTQITTYVTDVQLDQWPVTLLLSKSVCGYSQDICNQFTYRQQSKEWCWLSVFQW